MNFAPLALVGSMENSVAWLPRPFQALVHAPLQRISMWTGLAWTEMVQSYRRTMLGPLWITLSLVITVLAMTLVYGALFSLPSREYAAFLACGMIGWIWVSALLTEVGNTFIMYSGFIKSTRIDKSLFVWTACAKLAIVLFHQMIVWIGLVLLGIVKLEISTLFVVPAVILLFVFSIPVTAVASILFTRYRDLPRLMASSIVVLMMITPIFWQTQMIKGWRSSIIYANPAYYLVEIIRAPLLGQPEDPIVLTVMLAMTLFAWVFGAYFFRRYQKYVVYWL